MSEASSKLLKTAAKWIEKSDALLVTCGHGMYATSQIPDFRGFKGFQTFFPKLADLTQRQSRFDKGADFLLHPDLAWYKHSIMYDYMVKRSNPHISFKILKNIGDKSFKGNFHVVTSNIDGNFEEAFGGNSRIFETSGSIRYIQCISCRYIKPTYGYEPELEIDESELKTKNIPKCSECNSILRPNILLEDDDYFLLKKYNEQANAYKKFLHKNKNSKLMILELGVGADEPALRKIGDSFLVNEHTDCRFLRINPRNDLMVIHDIKEMFCLSQNEYEELLYDPNFDIDEYLSKLEQKEINQIEKVIGLNHNSKYHKEKMQEISKIVYFERKFLYDRSLNPYLHLREKIEDSLPEISKILNKI